MKGVTMFELHRVADNHITDTYVVRGDGARTVVHVGMAPSVHVTRGDGLTFVFSGRTGRVDTVDVDGVYRRNAIVAGVVA